MERAWRRRVVLCPENAALAEFMWEKKHHQLNAKRAISDNTDMTLYKAYSGICCSVTPITTLKHLSLIKGVGKWILRLLQEFFEADTGASQDEDIISQDEDKTTKGRRPKATKRYLPQKNSAAYALLVTLYKGMANGSDFMRKQELIDAAEASGLSRVPIVPEKGKGKPEQFGSSSRVWYSGWNCMKTLITKGLVAKSSNPAKYMLTVEGKESARECLSRSGQIDSTTTSRLVNPDANSDSDSEATWSGVAEDITFGSISLSLPKKSIDVPPQSLNRFLQMGYSADQVRSAFTEVSETSHNKDILSLWPSVLCRLREKQVYNRFLDPEKSLREDLPASSNASTFKDGQVDLSSLAEPDGVGPSRSGNCSFPLRACSSNGLPVPNFGSDISGLNIKALAMPPLLFGERFEEAYEVILVVDNREKFTTLGSRSGKIIENIRTQFRIHIKVRMLPVGDAIWIAKHKSLGSEYVLDFIVERKKVDDLRVSIKDNRYKDQKLRLQRCGLKKLIYVVEGDPNTSEAAESIKTACLTTEILEGFEVLRTSGLGDTLRKYGFLTQAISQAYSSHSIEMEKDSLTICPGFDEFIKRCRDLEKMTVSDVFAIQLMQVPQVTEEIAVAVLDLYPTLLSLARAYSLLEGDIAAQEGMLKNQSNNTITPSASRNIFKLVWGS